ncbi:hypothetical protein BOTBODRAFT_184963 [Botryobasidium botryosum FD-172 SS1]|uniref:Uncharacterized protein n=1 Tax=Botryobasidium botryosum (strain FD-172 SS1) TaxID=930990 RepID=A0A067N3G9_BOTB1|nr:hypothetical protein BOTBODRAFT_184963 [Botryobasidium botryosum FD-172 SS1]
MVVRTAVPPFHCDGPCRASLWTIPSTEQANVPARGEDIGAPSAADNEDIDAYAEAVFSQDGSGLLAATKEGMICVWEVAATVQMVIVPFWGDTEFLAFSLDGSIGRFVFVWGPHFDMGCDRASQSIARGAVVANRDDYFIPKSLLDTKSHRILMR